MGNIGNKPIKDIYEGLLQLSSSGEIAKATGVAIGLSAPEGSGTISFVKNLQIGGNISTS